MRPQRLVGAVVPQVGCHRAFDIDYYYNRSLIAGSPPPPPWLSPGFRRGAERCGSERCGLDDAGAGLEAAVVALRGAAPEAQGRGRRAPAKAEAGVVVLQVKIFFVTKSDHASIDELQEADPFWSSYRSTGRKAARKSCAAKTQLTGNATMDSATVFLPMRREHHAVYVRSRSGLLESPALHVCIPTSSPTLHQTWRRASSSPGGSSRSWRRLMRRRASWCCRCGRRRGGEVSCALRPVLPRRAQQQWFGCVSGVMFLLRKALRTEARAKQCTFTTQAFTIKRAKDIFA